MDTYVVRNALWEQQMFSAQYAMDCEDYELLMSFLVLCAS